jgi:hypothetical protein
MVELIVVVILGEATRRLAAHSEGRQKETVFWGPTTTIEIIIIYYIAT